jgi:hypothetical protein
MESARDRFFQNPVARQALIPRIAAVSLQCSDKIAVSGCKDFCLALNTSHAALAAADGTAWRCLTRPQSRPTRNEAGPERVWERRLSDPCRVRNGRAAMRARPVASVEESAPGSVLRWAAVASGAASRCAAPRWRHTAPRKAGSKQVAFEQGGWPQTPSWAVPDLLAARRRVVEGRQRAEMLAQRESPT